MPFSPVSEAIVLFSVPALFWHLLIVQLYGRVSIRRVILVQTFALVWTAGAYAFVRYQFGVPLLGDIPTVLVPVASLFLAAALAWAFRYRLLGDGVPQQVLIAVQLFRPIGLIFVLEDFRGTLPSIFAQPAGWGDLIAGMTALIVLVRHPRGRIPTREVVLVAVIGLLDFTSAFFFGATSSDSPLQLFAFGEANRALEYPLGMIPALLVPYAVACHVLSLAQLRRGSAAAADDDSAALVKSGGERR